MIDVFPTSIQNFIPWLRNFINGAEANMALLGWDQATIDDLKAFLADLENKYQEVIVTKTAAKAAVRAKNMSFSATRKAVRPRIAEIQAKQLVSNALKKNLGVKVHDTIISHEEPNIPSHLIVKGLSIGVNIISWKTNGNKRGTQYIIECRVGTEGEFMPVDTILSTKFTHTGQKPGVAVFYRVAARRGKLRSLSCAAVGIYT
ncbi:MAG: fibronectin type III domain-containing protein [Candidatus Cloacimonetes bacterium]|nr:fibronectin type III domain-containing protein [Candidatus Cloacimonadota bacterium]